MTTLKALPAPKSFEPEVVREAVKNWRGEKKINAQCEAYQHYFIAQKR
jgi:hypothetical protein